MEKETRILAIESSCDETSAAVIGMKNNQPIILSNIVSSQIDLHAKTGGVVPEVASRAHMEAITPVIAEALLWAKNQNAKIKMQNEGSHSVAGSFSSNRAIEQYNNAISFLKKEIDYIAVTSGPGLIGSLLVGFNAARSIAYALDKPIIPVNHIEGHIYSALLSKNQNSKIKMQNKSSHSVAGLSEDELTSQQINKLTFPVLALTVSGGHTSLTLMKDHGIYQTIGQTLDDAAGEAFDKVAKLLGLGYPGGPIVSKYAERFRNKSEIRISKSETNSNVKYSKNKNNLISASGGIPSECGTSQQINELTIEFPRPILNDGTFNFSFSGLKTAVLTYVKKYTDNGLPITDNDKSKICCAFEDAVVDVLVTKTLRAVEKYQSKSVILAGGVAANKHLRNSLESAIRDTKSDIRFLVPPINLCGDNAAMIGLAAYYHIQKNNISSWDKLEIDSNHIL